MVVTEKTCSFQWPGAAEYTFYKTKFPSQEFEWLFLAIDKIGVSKIGCYFFCISIININVL